MDQKGLRDLEARCIQEEPPRCRAACPLGLDARALCAAVAAKNMTGAWAVLRRHMPLAGVLARICDHPCEEACLRGQAGDPVRIGALERAVAAAPEPRARPLPMPKRPGTIAVTGSGLSSLTAAWDLAGKGFSVTILTGSGGLGGRLAQFPETLLPKDVVTAEIELLKKRGAVFKPYDGPCVDAPASLLGEFDAVCLGGDDPSLPLSLTAPDSTEFPVTAALETPGLFACGLGADDAPYSPIRAAAEGRRAALSVDRFLQKVSLTAGRPPETQATRLYTNIDGAVPLPAVPMADPETGYSPDEAQEEAGRCLDCQCLECLKACPYLEAYKGYPKVYARRVYNNLSIVKGHHADNILINSCMLCGLCTAICPEDFPMADLCLSSRRDMTGKNVMPPSAHEFALLDMAFAQGEDCALARPAPGVPDGAVKRAFFPGCQLAGLSPDGVMAAYGALRDLFPGQTGILLSCCGAPARWAGREDLFAASMKTLRASWEGLGKPEIVAACPACMDMLEEGLPEARTVSLWEVFDQSGLAVPALQGTAVLAPLDPCTARNRPGVRDAVRSLLRKAGAELVEPPYSGELAKCCGFGGLMSEANPELAKTVAGRRAAESPEDYAAYCAMCRDRLASAGKRALHLLDLLFPDETQDPAAQPAATVTKRHDGRAALKRTILREVYGESLQEEARLQLVMSPETAARLDARRILEDDLRQLIAQAEAAKAYFLRPETGHKLAGRRIGNVTFWAEYEMTDAGCLVHNAYCHRMRIKTDAKEARQ